ncbi:MAG TPA: hypothetical protein VGL11_13570 [Candidatus Binatia bacterium]
MPSGKLSPGTAIQFFGWLTVFFWLSLVTRLALSFLATRELGQSLAAELSDSPLKDSGVDPMFDLPRDQLEALITWTFQLRIIKSLALAFVGVLSGVLLIARRRSGRLVAVALCSIVFSYWLYWLARFAIRANFSPIIFGLLSLEGGIQDNIVNPLFFILTVFFLTRKPLAHGFKPT